jgi:hypothetical protein
MKKQKKSNAYNNQALMGLKIMNPMTQLGRLRQITIRETSIE